MAFLRGIFDFAVGLVIVFSGIILAGLLGYQVFLTLGFPEEWFASDYPDPRGSALCSLLQFACVLLVSLTAGGILRSRGVEVTMGRAMRAINPLSWWCALLAVMLFEWPFEADRQIFGVWSGVVALVGWLLIVPVLRFQAKGFKGVPGHPC